MEEQQIRPIIASALLLGTLALIAAESLHTGTIKDSTARLLLAAGIILFGGKEVISALSDRFT